MVSNSKAILANEAAWSTVRVHMHVLVRMRHCMCTHVRACACACMCGCVYVCPRVRVYVCVRCTLVHPRELVLKQVQASQAQEVSRTAGMPAHVEHGEKW